VGLFGDDRLGITSLMYSDLRAHFRRASSARPLLFGRFTSSCSRLRMSIDVRPIDGRHPRLRCLRRPCGTDHFTVAPSCISARSNPSFGNLLGQSRGLASLQQQRSQQLAGLQFCGQGACLRPTFAGIHWFSSWPWLQRPSGPLSPTVDGRSARYGHRGVRRRSPSGE